MHENLDLILPIFQVNPINVVVMQKSTFAEYYPLELTLCSLIW